MSIVLNKWTLDDIEMAVDLQTGFKLRMADAAFSSRQATSLSEPVRCYHTAQKSELIDFIKQVVANEYRSICSGLTEPHDFAFCSADLQANL